MTLRSGEIVLASLADLYLCAETTCGAVSNSSERCPVCHSAVISLSSLVNRELPLTGIERESQ